MSIWDLSWLHSSMSQFFLFPRIVTCVRGGAENSFLRSFLFGAGWFVFFLVFGVVFLFFLSLSILSGGTIFILFRGFWVYLFEGVACHWLTGGTGTEPQLRLRFGFGVVKSNATGERQGQGGRTTSWSMGLLPVSLSLGWKKLVFLNFWTFLALIWSSLFWFLEFFWSLIVVTCCL